MSQHETSADAGERAPDYLVIGHITCDIVGDGTTPGGTALYAARTAARLGLRSAIVTSASPAYLATLDPRILEGIAVHNKPADSPSTFTNIYRDGHRSQFLRGRAHTLGPADIPPLWRQSAIVHFGPVADEVQRDLLSPDIFPRALRAATPQGWLRSWDESGRITAARGAAAAELMPTLPVLVFSEEDIERDAGVITACRARCEIVVVTSGAQGATAYQGDRETHFPAYPTREVDPTGAGDVFAAAFFARLHATGSLVVAGSYASVAASFIVESPGAGGIPTPGQIEERLARYVPATREPLPTDGSRILPASYNRS